MDEAFPIERATLADARDILALQHLAYRSEAELLGDFAIEPLRQTLPDIEAEFGSKAVLKLAIGGRIIGSVRSELVGNICRIGKLIVHPDFQNQGLGTVLLMAAETLFPEARCMELFTSHKSERNLAFYARRGYAEHRREVLSDRVTLVFLGKERERS